MGDRPVQKRLILADYKANLVPPTTEAANMLPGYLLHQETKS